MNRGFGFVLAVPIFICAILILMITNYVRTEQENFDEYVLSFQVDYATDAAVGELVEGAHLGLDYQDWGRVRVDPETALRVFETVMLMNDDQPLTDRAFTRFASDFMPLFAVCAYDGYYVYEQYPDNDGGYVLKPTPKLPYSYTVGDTYYALNLGLTNSRRLVDGKLKLVQNAEEGITPDMARYYINSWVSDDLMVRYQEYQRNNQASHVGHGAIFYLPQAMTTFTQVNAIEGPTVIALIDNWQGSTVKELSSFSVGGARIEPTRQVACYYVMENGKTVKYYAYADLLPEGVAIVDLVPGPKQAAEKGFYYDFNYKRR